MKCDASDVDGRWMKFDVNRPAPSLHILGLGAGVALHAAGPLEEAHHLTPLVPQEAAELGEADALHLDSAIGLDAPAKVRAAPGREVMAAGGVPQET